MDVTDDRIRYPVFAFSGGQGDRELPIEKTLALDLPAIIPLDFLGLLEKTLTHYKRIVIAPTTLSELFTERQFLRVTQPSQLVRAQRIQELIATGRQIGRAHV